MASTATRRKPARASAADRRARTLVRDGKGAARHITMRVLQGGLERGKSPVAVRQPGPAGRTPRKGRRKQATVGDVPPVPALAMAVAPIGLKADVTSKLTSAAPAFGDVLRSIGHAAAVTQTALDETALESLKTLAGQQVDVPVLIEQTLDNDGKPTSVTIKTAPMPLTSIITPSMQEVRNLTMRMDLRVQSFNATSGIKFNQNIASAGVSFSRHSFGFAVGMNNTNVNAQFSNMSDFSSGSVMVAVDIVDRTGFEFPKPLEYGIGANLLLRLKSITQTATTNPAGFQRVATLTAKMVKLDGSVVDLASGQYDVSAPPGLLPDTTTAGELKFTRSCATATEPYLERKISVIVGQLTKEASFFV